MICTLKNVKWDSWKKFFFNVKCTKRQLYAAQLKFPLAHAELIGSFHKGNYRFEISSLKKLRQIFKIILNEIVQI